MKAFYEWFFLEEGRTGDALFSWQHLVSVTVAIVIFVGLAILLGLKFRDNKKGQFVSLLVAGIFIVLVQIAKIFFLCWNTTDTIWGCIIGNAPLYLCDMAIFILPLCAITKGRFRDWCLDFLAIWGVLMGFFGTYLAGNIYPAHAAISWAAINSLLNHSISLFGAVFIWVTGLNKMKKTSIPFTVGILVIFMTAALVLDWTHNLPSGHNFMFFRHGDGTPFDFFKNYLSFGKIWVYDIWIYVLQCGYMVAVYFIYYAIANGIRKAKVRKVLLEEEKEERARDAELGILEEEEREEEPVTEEVKAEPAPVVEETAPVEETPKEETPVEAPKAEEPKVEETPVVEQKAEEKPAETAPVEDKPAPIKKAAPKKTAKKEEKKPAAKKGPAAKSRTYHLVKREDGKWEVKYAGGQKAIKLFDTQKEALEYSKKMAENQGGFVLVHNSKGANKGRIQKSK